MATKPTNLVKLDDHREPQPTTRRKADRVHLTTKRVNDAKPGDRRIRIADAEVVGLHLVVRPSGSKSYVVRGRIGHGRKRPIIDVTIGRVDNTSLADARKRAKLILAKMRDGQDPRQKSSNEQNVGDIVAAFLSHHQARGTKTVSKIERCLKRTTRGLRSQPFDHVTLQQWSSAIDRTRKDNGIAPARDDAKWLRSAARWAKSQGLIHSFTALDVVAPEPSFAEQAQSEDAKTAQWTLMRSQWPTFWEACKAARSPYLAGYLRTLALTGMRRREASLATWAHVDLDLGEWNLPAAHTKQARPHTVYIGPLLRQVLVNLPRHPSTDLIFPGRGGVVMTGWSKMLKPVTAALDDRVQLHGLRRGYRTALSELRVDRDVSEMMIAHTAPDLVRRYDKAELADMRRDAQNLLEVAWMEALNAGV